MSGLLAFGDELVLWLEQEGFERNDPPEAAKDNRQRREAQASPQMEADMIFDTE
jgi:hypothetical protein